MASTYPTSLDAFTNPLAADLLTSPSHAQQHSDINDAVEALEAKVAIGNTVLGTYTAHTPTFLNVTAGNGTTSGAYCRVNSFVHYYGSFTLGTTSAVTGAISISLPININADVATGISTIGIMNLLDTSAAVTYQGIARYNAAVSSCFAGVINASGTYAQWNGVNATVPMTWATGDSINFNLYYRAA
jgi:hypothetical protein